MAHEQVPRNGEEEGAKAGIHVQVRSSSSQANPSLLSQIFRERSAASQADQKRENGVSMRVVRRSKCDAVRSSQACDDLSFVHP